MRYRITFHFEDEAIYGHVEDTQADNDSWYEGSWLEPFPNTQDDSLAFGLNECMTQSDIGAALVHEHGSVVEVKVAKLKKVEERIKPPPIEEILPDIQEQLRTFGFKGILSTDGKRLLADQKPVIKHFRVEHYNDIDWRPYCGLHPRVEVVKILSEQIAFELGLLEWSDDHRLVPHKNKGTSG